MDRLRRILFAWACAALLVGPGPAPAADGDPGPVEIRIALAEDGAAPYHVGDKLELALWLLCHNVPSGYAVYLVLNPMVGDEVLMPEGGTITMSNLTLAFNVNGLRESDGGPYHVGPAHFPLELHLGPEILTKLAVQVFKDEKVGTQLAQAYGPEGLSVIFGFLAFVGPGGDHREKARFSFTAPQLEHPYDGILLTPVLMRDGEESGERRILFRNAEMHSLRLAVAARAP